MQMRAIATTMAGTTAVETHASTGIVATLATMT